MRECDGASACGESTATPTNDARPASDWLNVRSSGASRLQGAHHEPQKLTNTGLPSRCVSENALPSNDVPVIGAAG